MKRILFSLFVLIAFVSCTDVASQKSSTAGKYKKEGTKYARQGKYPQALDLFTQGIQLSESEGGTDYKSLSYLYLDVGNIYLIYKDYERALDYYRDGYKTCLRLQNHQMESSFLNNMCVASAYIGNIKDAQMYNEMAFRLPKQEVDVKLYHKALNDAVIACYNNKENRALIMLQDYLAHNKKTKLDINYVSAVYFFMYKAYEKMGQADSAIYYAQYFDNLMQPQGLSNMLVDCYESLSHLYEQKGDKSKAAYYQAKFVATSDSVLNMREFNKVKSKLTAYETGRNTKHIEQLDTTIHAQQKWIFTVSVVLILAVAIGFYIWKQKKKLQQANISLFERNKELLANAERNYQEALQRAKEKEKDGEREGKESKSYQLEEELKQSLLEKISGIMNNTKEFCDAEFSLNALASLIGSNTKYVSQIINDTYQENFRTFINNYRIIEAQKRLMDTETYGKYTIKAISESVGYKSQSNFIISFRRITGMTPSLYQKMALRENNQNKEKQD